MPRTRCAPSPREAKRSGERVGVRGIFSARPPHPILHVATTEVPSPPQAGRGRNNYDRTRGHISPFFHTAVFVPAARFCARVLKLWLRYPDRRGGGAPRDVRVLARHPLGLHVTRQARRLTRRLASHDAGRSPPGALTVAILGSGPALPSPAAPLSLRFGEHRIGHSELLASGS